MIQKFDWIEKNLRPLFFQSRSNIWYLVFLCPISCTKSGTSARVGTMWPSDCSYIWLIWNEAQDFVTTVGCDLEASLKGDCIQKVDRVHGQWTLWQHDLLPSCPELESGQNELLPGQCGPPTAIRYKVGKTCMLMPIARNAVSSHIIHAYFLYDVLSFLACIDTNTVEILIIWLTLDEYIASVKNH